MRIAALLKPVLALAAAPTDRERSWREQDGELVADPYGLRAVAQACELAAAVGDGTVTVLTLGPARAADLVRAAMEAGHATDVVCDGVLLAGPGFAGSDTLATARALAAAVSRRDYDLVLAGRSDVDADVGGVGPQLAELLGLPFVGGARHLSVQRETLRVRCERDDGWAQVDVEVPAVVSCAERLIDPSWTASAAAPPGPLEVLTAAELGSGPWGAAASPTRTGAVRTRAVERERLVLDGAGDDAARRAVARLRERGALDAPAALGAPIPPAQGERGEAVAVAVEPHRSHVGRELLGAAARLASAVDGHVVAVSPEPPDAEALASWGADAVVHLQGSDVEEDVAGGLAAWSRVATPWAILAPSTAWGREVAARAAAQLGAGLIGDAVELALGEDGRLAAGVPVLGGQLLVTVSASSPVQLVAVRPGSLALPRPRAAGRPEIRTMTLERRSRLRVRSRSRDDDLDLLARAPIVVGVGLGVDRAEYPALAPLLEGLGAELAATRPVTDRRWLPHARQVGLTGRAIAPRLYVTVGVRGAFEHMVGACAAGTILAVHPDRDTPVFDAADIGIVGDWHRVVPALAAALAGAGVTTGG
ncbi:MAG TPA: FAD-binding protein [Acidimicrobiia bacterium]|nr:FAD-binding protein [Acidimicrobiia bacterium]